MDAKQNAPQVHCTTPLVGAAMMYVSTRAYTVLVDAVQAALPARPLPLHVHGVVWECVQNDSAAQQTGGAL